MSHTFNRDDVVEYKTGKTYLVGFQTSSADAETIGVCGWKNGKAFGAHRYLPAADCKLVGRRVPINDGAAWGFIPAS
jgi:hypothetical protein